MKKIVITGIMLLSMQTTFAIIGHVTLLRRNAQLSIGTGMNLPHVSKKSNTLGEVELVGNVYKPLIGSGWDKPSKVKLSIGLNAELATNMGINFEMGNYKLDGVTAFAIQSKSATTSMPLIATSNTAGFTRGFRALVGPQLNVHFGRIMLSTAVQAGYIKHPARSWNAVQNITINGKVEPIAFLKHSELDTKGLLLSSQLKLSYWLSNKIALYATAAYAMGPKVQINEWRLTPSATPNAQGEYTSEQIKEGTYTPSNMNTTRLSTTVANLGVIVALGKKQDYVGHVTLLR